MSMMPCQYPGGCTNTFDNKGSSNRKYCDEHKGGPRVQGAKHEPTVVTKKCNFPGCLVLFSTTSPNRQYCDDHYNSRVRRHLAQEALFEEPRRFEEVKILNVAEGSRIFVVNDTQRPFQDNATMEAVERFWHDFQPNYEIYAGDIADCYLISQFDKNPSRRFHLQDELDETHDWLGRRAEDVPNAERIYIGGNHEDRMRRWMWRFGKELSGLRSLELPALLGFDEFKIRYLPYQSVVDFLGYRIEHGYKASESRAYPINVSRYMAIATGSSGLCGHSHHFSVYGWRDASGGHSYIENGCLCRFDLEYAAFPNWQQSFTYGIVHNGKVHLIPVQVYPDGFHAEGGFYPRVTKRRGKR